MSQDTTEHTPSSEKLRVKSSKKLKPYLPHRWLTREQADVLFEALVSAVRRIVSDEDEDAGGRIQAEFDAFYEKFKQAQTWENALLRAEDALSRAYQAGFEQGPHSARL